jgi:hypothetical protein
MNATISCVCEQARPHREDMMVAPLSHHFTTDGEFLSPLPLCSSPVPKFEREVWHGGGRGGVEAIGDSSGQRWKACGGFQR